MRGDRTRDQSIKSRTLYRTELARHIGIINSKNYVMVLLLNHFFRKMGKEVCYEKSKHIFSFGSGY